MSYYNPYRKKNNQTVKQRSPYEKTEAQKRLEAAERAKKKEIEKPNVAVRTLATGGDVLSNIYTGAIKGLEGIVDLGAGLIGGIGGLFSEDFKEGAREFVSFDFAGKVAGGDYLQELTKYSYTNESKVGEIVENIANGVGQMLPTVAAALATGGTSLGATAAQTAGIATASASAAGSSIENAMNDGADYGQALVYGATMGAVEGATEKLLGGVDVKAIKGIGKGLAKEAGEEIAEQGGKRILKGMLEEAGEEAISELVDPMARTMYQGGEALGDYLTPEYWKGVGEAALVGGLTGAAYSGTIGHAIHKAKGTNADMDASFEAVEELAKQQAELEGEGRLDGNGYSNIKSSIKGNMENVSAVLKKASPEQRAKLIEKYGISDRFDENGDLRDDYVRELDRQIEAGKRGNMSPYVSSDLAANEERLKADIDAINADRAEGEEEIRIFDGELSEQGKEYWTDLKRARKNLNAISGENFNVALVNGNASFKGVAVKGNDIYINKNIIEDGSWAGTLIHELTHFSEGSPEYVKFMKYLLSDGELTSKKISELTEEGNPYGFSNENVERLTERGKAAPFSGKRALQYSKNENFTEEIDEWNKDGKPDDGYFVLGTTGDVLQGLGAIESDIYMLSDKINTILREHPEMTLDEIKKIPDILEDPVLILKSRNVGRGERANTRLVIFGNIKAKNGQPILSVLDLRPNEKNLIIDDMQKLTSAYTKTQNPTEFIQSSDIVYADKKRTTPLLRTIGFQMPIELNESGSIGSISYKGQNVNISGKNFSEVVDVNVSKENVNTKSEKSSSEASDAEFISELIAGLAEDSVGADGAFIDRIVRGNEGLTAKILNKLQDAISYLASRKTAEARAQYKSLKRAEKLFTDALKATGRAYSDGKIIGAGDEKEDKLQYSIVNMDNGMQYVEATENQVIKGDDTKKWAQQVANYINNIIRNGNDLKIKTTQGDYLTITRDTAYKAGSRNSIKNPDGSYRTMTDQEYRVKLNAEIHINELAETSKKSNRENTPDYKHHRFAKDGFTYRTAYFKDFDGKYYRLTISVGENGDISTVYNVGKLKEDTLPSGKIISTFSGSKANNVSSDNSIPENSQNVNTKLQYSKKTQGQRAKEAANVNRQKVYTKQDAHSVISTIVSERLNTEDGYFGKLIGKSRDTAIESLWLDFNKAKPSEKVARAYKLADYIIQNATLEGMETTPETELAIERVSVLRDYMHKFDLSGLRGEIKHKYDKDSREISLIWGRREGGISPDSIVEELGERGIIISAENPADILFELHELYRSSRDAIRQEGDIQLKDTLDEAEYLSLRQEIVKDIVDAHSNKGEPSTLAIVSNNYEKILKRMKGEFRENSEKNKLRNRVIYIFNQIKEQKKGAFVSASEYQNRAFKEGFEKLTSTLWRGNLREDRAVRAEIKKVYEWYIDPENRLFHNEKGEATTLYNTPLADALNTLGNGEGRFSLPELKAFEFVAETVKHMIDTYNKVWDGEKWIDAKTEAKRYVRRIEANRRYRARQLYRFAAIGKYNRMFLDNASVFRAADCYEDNGFFTEAFGSLRRGLIGMQIAEAEMREKAEEFYKRNRKYVKRLTEEEIEYRGKKLTVAQFISVYMTSKRKQSHLALAKTGFKCADKKGDAIDFGALTSNPESITTEEQASALVAKMRSEMERSLTKQDMEYIAVLEEIFRIASGLKVKTDMIRWGYSNALKSYYYPIKRADQAKNVDVTFFDEMMATDMTFNRDTVKSSARLYVEPVNTVFDRHIHGVALYSNLALTLESITRVINVNVSDIEKDSITKRVGDERYLGDTYKALEKLIGDIKGMRVTGDEGFGKLWSRVRSNYAKATLAANPKIFATQLSSFFAATSILDYKNIVKGFGVSDKFKDVDKYCSLAKLRNTDNTVVKAQTLSDRTGKVSDVLLTPVGKIDRWVVVELFGGCQAQIEAEGGAKIGAEENKIAAGKLLERVILETQQNALVTERSQAMRSEQEYLKFLTMFSADAMKVVGRVIDSIGEVSVLRAKKKDFKADPNKNAAEIAALEKERAKLAGEIEEYRKSAEEKRIATENVIDLTLDTELSTLVENVYGSLKYKKIAQYILDALGEEKMVLSDGKLAIIDKSDAMHIANKAAPKKTAKIARIKDIIAVARIYAQDLKAEHNKFDEFYYYEAIVKFGNETFPIYLNVGKAKNDGSYHIYDITNKIKDTADRINGLERPKPNEGYALKNGISDEAPTKNGVSRPVGNAIPNASSTNSIPQNLENVNSNFENDIDELEREISSLDAQIKKLKSEPRDIDGKIKRANGKARRAIAALTAQSVFMAAIALFFKYLYAKTKDKEKEEIIADTAFDFVGNMLGGLPLWRDVYSCITDGFEVDIFNMSVINDFLDSCRQCFELVTDAASGDDITTKDVLAKVKKLGVALGPLGGIPVRNTYNLVTGLSNRFIPQVGYNIESIFEAQPYSSDLKKAIENGDEKMIGTIAGLMTKESIGSQSESVQSALSELVGQGYDVLPRSLGDTVTHGGQQIELTAAQKKRFRKLYDISDQSVEELVGLSQFKAADDKIKAKALRFIYDTYWQLALADILETDEANKNVLFAEAINIEKLALIISTARNIEADKDKNGNAISGSKKKKVMEYIESLNMSAAQKYMIAGYLGYRNLKGQEKVEAYISKLGLTKQEKTKLLEYSGYAAA